jgi:hypothetical protein
LSDESKTFERNETYFKDRASMNYTTPPTHSPHPTTQCAAFVFLFFLIAGVSLARNYVLKGKPGGDEVEVKPDRNPPLLGDNRIDIEMRDPGGKPITGANDTPISQ